MNEILWESAYFGMVLSVVYFWFGTWLRRRFPSPLVNPLLIATILTIATIVLLDIDYDAYTKGASHLTWLLTPSTVCLAVPLYRQLQLLRRHWQAIVISVGAGCVACAVTVAAMSRLLRLTPEIYHSLQPKSVTTAIALGVGTQLGGLEGIISLGVMITGLFGVVIVDVVLRLLKVTHPVAKGLAIGNSIHAIGTAHALELGEIEGAMSGLTIVVAGIMTVILAPLFSGLG